MDPTILASIKDLSVVMNGHQVLKNINFDIYKNEIIALIGPNGAGKTTLFKALLNLIKYSGQINWIPDIKIGYVPQKLFVENDLPLTTEDFFKLKNIDNQKIEKILELVGFLNNTEFESHHSKQILKENIGALSGGELQRILIAWSLVDDPDVLLFDEPTNGLDLSSENNIYQLIYKLKEKMTILIISHELQIVYQYATKVICLNKSSICMGSPNQILNNENLSKLFGQNTALYEHH